jgi:hypothetical protein
VILLRLADERSLTKVEVMRRFLQEYSGKIAGNFVVVTEDHVRFARRP